MTKVFYQKNPYKANVGVEPSGSTPFCVDLGDGLGLGRRKKVGVLGVEPDEIATRDAGARAYPVRHAVKRSSPILGGLFSEVTDACSVVAASQKHRYNNERQCYLG